MLTSLVALSTDSEYRIANQKEKEVLGIDLSFSAKESELKKTKEDSEDKEEDEDLDSSLVKFRKEPQTPKGTL